MPPLARPADPTLMYHHCRDADDEQGADRLNTVVSTVVEDMFPQASLECKARLVEAWEKVMGSCPKAAAKLGGDRESALDPTTEADLVAALEHMEEDETQLVEY